jgi:4,5-dihydroxyphthalate decarboxylase
MGEELRYFRKRGFFPVMHLVVVKRELLKQRPELCREMLDMFEAAKQEAYHYYDDPDYSLIVWARNHYEAQLKELGPDPWVNGLKANYLNLTEFLEDSYDQGLTQTLLKPEHLFHESMWDT